MHIICPHCTTSYAIDLATLGAAGRTVRCSRCKEVWLARPEDAIEVAAPAPAMMAAGADRDPAGQTAAGWEAAVTRNPQPASDTPVVDSPSISAGWPGTADGDEAAQGRLEPQTVAGRRRQAAPKRPSVFTRRFGAGRQTPSASRALGTSFINLPTACVAMGALALALMIWRVDVVRLMPQTAAFYKLVGFEVNARGLAFKDVKVSTEAIDGKPVLVIEGSITGETRKAVELPRLRFAVRDAKGSEIYAWNAVLEQPVLKPGERAWFKSRLASPPPEARSIDVRFFNKRDIGGGQA